MNRKKVVFIALVLTAIVACSCGTQDNRQTHSSNAESPWNSKVEYIGNNSAVTKLVGMVLGDKYGGYQLELQTKTEPFGLRITITDATRDLSRSDFDDNASRLLALIRNAGYIAMEDGNVKYELSADEATEKVGCNIKDLYDSESKYLQLYH